MKSQRMISALSGVLLFLTACASQEQTLVRPVTLDVPVAVPCAPPAVEAPHWPLDTLSREADIYDTMRALLAECALHRAYETKLLGALETCR